MSLSDCPKCWNTPCNCGYEYRNYSYNRKISLVSVILGIPEEEIKKCFPKEKVIKNGN